MFSLCEKYPKPLIIAHRGASESAPENTLAAFKKAIEDKAQAIEADVRLTRDKEVVIIHDSRLERTTNGRGRVCDFDLKDLQTLDSGSWFHPKFANEKIPTLTQLFKLARKKIGINIEIKSLSKHSDIIVEKCIKLIQQYRMQNKVLISTFQHSLISKIKLLDPNIMTGIIYSPVIHFSKPPTKLALKYNTDAFVISKSYLRETMVKEAHDNNISVIVYTVENFDELERMKKFGVDCVITNTPKNIYKMLNKI